MTKRQEPLLYKGQEKGRPFISMAVASQATPRVASSLCKEIRTGRRFLSPSRTRFRLRQKNFGLKVLARWGSPMGVSLPCRVSQVDFRSLSLAAALFESKALAPW